MNLVVAFMRAMRALMPPDVTDGSVNVTRAGDQVTVTLTIAGAERPILSATGRRQRVADARQRELFESAPMLSAPERSIAAPDTDESPYVLLCTPKGTGEHEGLSWAARLNLLWFHDRTSALYWHSEGGSGKGWNESKMVTSIARRDLPAVLAAAKRAELMLTVNDLLNHTGDSMLRDGAVVRLADGTTREVIGFDPDTMRVKLSDNGIASELHALSAFETATDGSGVFRLVTSPAQRMKKARAKKSAELTPDQLHERQRVRVKQSMAGISGVPVALAGEPVTIMSVGPKRVKVRPDGQGRTYQIPFAAIELLSEEP